MNKKEKNNFTKLTQKKGISLITLVITIIVIIILAAAIVMSLNNNNIITNASTARYEQDRDYIQSALELAIQKVVLRHKGGIELEVGAINETAKDVKLVDGKVTWTSNDLAGLTGKIVFDEGEDTDTTFYVGEKLPVYGSQTTWYVDEQGRVVLQIANKVFGAEEVPKRTLTASKIMRAPSEYYGKTVKYNSEKGTNYEWQILHADAGGIYLITKDFITREDIPNSWKNGVETSNKPNYGDDDEYPASAYFTNILGDYENGSDDIKESMRNLNSSYFGKGYTSTGDNMKAVAYMLDTDAWGKYADEKANYAIGGPSLELLCKSFSAYLGSEFGVCEAISDVGYSISINGQPFVDSGVFASKSDANALYTTEGFGDFFKDYSFGCWLATPGSYDTTKMFVVLNLGHLMGFFGCDGWSGGFRPVVYLKPSALLVEQDNGVFGVE